MHFINHSDQELVIPKHSYVGAMKKVRELDQDMRQADTSPEPVNQHALSEHALPKVTPTVVQRPSGKLWCLRIQYC